MYSLTTLVGYTQLIDQPTHVISNFSSSIDLIFASNPSVICDSGVELSFEQVFCGSVYTSYNLMSYHYFTLKQIRSRVT